jgi:hypothetical protein
MPKTSPAEAHTEAGRQVVRSTTSFLKIVDGGEYRGMRKSPEDTKLVDAITDNCTAAEGGKNPHLLGENPHLWRAAGRLRG